MGGARSRSSQAGTQATASTMIQGGVTEGRSHGGGLGGGTRDAISCDGASDGGDPEGAKETRSKGDTTGQGGAGGSWDHGRGGTQKTVVELEQPRTMAEPEGRHSPVKPKRRRAEVQPGIQESCGENRVMPDQSEAGGMRDHSGASGPVR